MPSPSKGARLWLRKAQRDKSGRLTHRAVWLIRDGDHQESTRCSAGDHRKAEIALAEYIARKHVSSASRGERDPAAIPIADVIAIYARDVATRHARPHETAQRAKALLGFFGDKMLCEVTGATCRDYVAQRSTDAAARRELEDLRAAIRYHRREGLCSQVVEVVLPPERPRRERWLTRSEAAWLMLKAWRYRERQKGRATGRRSRQHVAKFCLLALYTGTRASAICSAALEPMPGRGWIDLDRGVFYRRPAARRETKKRQPPVRLPDSLLAHLRRWKRRGQRFVIEWNGRPVKAIEKAFANAARDAGLGPDVVPHTLRHTAATWQLQAGTDPYEAAGYLGMTAEVLWERYGHHHPDHQNNARTALGRHRKRHRMAETDREQTPQSISKIA